MLGRPGGRGRRAGSAGSTPRRGRAERAASAPPRLRAPERAQGAAEWRARACGAGPGLCVRGPRSRRARATQLQEGTPRLEETPADSGLPGGFGVSALRRASRLPRCRSAGDLDRTTGCFKAGPPLSWERPLAESRPCSDLTGGRLRSGLGRGCRRGATQRPKNS
ncbi:unnamed protein product [Rangifer tarandus platyrhynchus]|uniref:Uncharacterized protein n=2 Tax=Rangifer tarandus platyrhynchus TaxID=3082113 RepID=A0ABN8Y9G0_RANTA|nr:unnamed protein product [Rangifer tarandus platyrhynchus]CAI9696086.1 unnamed protein product [Rangifer tarandus platyrhynchus]